MNLTNLSNTQLYALLQNRRLDSSITQSVRAEWERRQLTAEEVQKFVEHYAVNSPADAGQGLPLQQKIFLILVPAVFTFQILRATRDLANNQRRKWKDFWWYVSIGYFLWTLAIILMVRWMRR
jgi:hypothetical protein